MGAVDRRLGVESKLAKPTYWRWPPVTIDVLGKRRFARSFRSGDETEAVMKEDGDNSKWPGPAAAGARRVADDVNGNC